jgi:hypothetical protein
MQNCGITLMAWPVRPEFFSLYQWKIWSTFLKYLVETDLILMLSKFSGQIGPKPKSVLCSIQQFDRSDQTGRVNGKRPWFPFFIGRTIGKIVWSGSISSRAL